MARQWGRKETIIWPPHVPLMSYCAIAGAFVLTLFFAWERYAFQLPPLQKAYMTDYARAGVGSAFDAHQSYRLLYLGGSKAKPRLAMPIDFAEGEMTLPNGKRMPFSLSELAQAQGYRFPFRGPAEKLADTSMYRWQHDVVYGGARLWRLSSVSMIEGGLCLALALALAVPEDIRRFKEMKYGRVLRGPRMLDPTEFNKAQKGDGLGFKTTESGSMMRIPLHKEAQHLQLMGDTGVGKTQLIMQCLRQIRGRGNSALVYDPACEYIQRFYDAQRGDIVLNPLDARCPYWGPAQELESEDEAYAIATSLYAPKTDKVDEFFHETPAQIFAHLLKRGPTPHQLAAWMSSDTELMKMVDGTEMAFYIDRKAGPQRAGVLSSLGSEVVSNAAGAGRKTSRLECAYMVEDASGMDLHYVAATGAGHAATTAFALD